MFSRRHEDAVVLALHGFTLTGAMFAALERRSNASFIAPDLPGHGGRGASGTSWPQAVAEVVELARTTGPDLVLGYSMGGRLVLGAAVQAPEFFPGLVLISTSTGIVEPSQRAARHHEDWRRAKSIETIGLAGFLEIWAGNPLLRSSTSELDLAAIRSANSPNGLAAALRGMGQGEQPDLFPALGSLPMPVTWVAGSRDRKYVDLAQRAAATCPLGSFSVVDGASHNVVADNPDAVAALVDEQLSLRNV